MILLKTEFTTPVVNFSGVHFPGDADAGLGSALDGSVILKFETWTKASD